jgi:hypothetical protein
MTTNNQIKEFLTYYLDLPISPQYAVMIKGPWGSGKSHFVKELVAERDKQQHLYVSLNGISSKTEIEQEFFRQLHPVLSSKAARLTGKLLQGALKTTINFDWNKDGRQDASGQLGLPDVDFSKYIKGPHELVLIFDDLERCRMAVPEVLGYLNYFVEQEGCKVVILANEDEILERKEELADKTGDYARIREKLIGKTFKLDADVGAALHSFLREINNIPAQRNVASNIPLIQSLFIASKSGNLRHLRQALLDFDRLVEHLEISKPNAELLTELLTTLLVLSLETRSNQLKNEEIKTIDRGWLTAAFRDDKRVNHLLALRSKYDAFDAFNSILPKDIWGKMFETGLIPKEDIKREVLRSKYYAKEEDRPVWLRLWEMYDHDDVTLRASINEADSKLDRCDFRSSGELLHVCGALLKLSEINVYASSAKEIAAKAKKNIDALKKSGELLTERREQSIDHLSWSGRMFHGRESATFRDILDYIKTSTTEAVTCSYPNVAAELVLLARAETEKFGEALRFRNGTPGPYYNVPILKYFDPHQFAALLSDLDAPKLKTICHMLQSRYEGKPPELRDEKQWLDQLKSQLAPFIADRKGSMAGFWLKRIGEEAAKAFTEEETPE